MWRVPYSEDLHELLKSDCLVELESLLADICKMFLRDEVTNPIEHGLQFLLPDSAILSMQVEHFEKSLALRSLKSVLMLLLLLLLLLHSNI